MGIILLVFAVMFGPPIIFTIIGLDKRKVDADKAKGYYLLAVLYLIVAGGICATMLANLRF